MSKSKTVDKNCLENEALVSNFACVCVCVNVAMHIAMLAKLYAIYQHDDIYAWCLSYLLYAYMP
jgi:Na+/glutamate symporter